MNVPVRNLSEALLHLDTLKDQLAAVEAERDTARAEAVATWIEKEATENRQRMGEYYERSVEGMLEEAAAIRAGTVGGNPE